LSPKGDDYGHTKETSSQTLMIYCGTITAPQRIPQGTLKDT